MTHHLAYQTRAIDISRFVCGQRFCMFRFSALLAARVTISQHHQPTQSGMSTNLMLRRHTRRAALNYAPLQYGIANTDGEVCHGSDLDPRIASHAAATSCAMSPSKLQEL